MSRSMLLVLILCAARIDATGTPIAPSPIGRAPGMSGPSSSVFVDGRFITVWSYRPQYGGHIYASIHDGEGRRLSPEAFPIISHTPASGFPPMSNLVDSGDVASLFWWDGDAYQLTSIDRDGRALRTVRTDLPPASRIQAVWNGRHFGVAVDVIGAREISSHLHTIDPEGRSVVAPVHVGTNGFILGVIEAQDSFVLLHRRYRSVTVLEVGPGESITTLHHFEGGAVGAKVRPDGSIRLAWTEWGSGSIDPTPVRTAVLTPDGRVVSAATLPFRGHGIDVLSDDNERATFFVLRRTAQYLAEIDILDVTQTGVAASVTTILPGFDWLRLAVSGDTILLTGADPGMAVVAAVLRDRRVVSSEVISLTPAHQTVPQLVPLSGRYLAVWSEVRGGSAVTRRTILDGTGNRLTPVVDAQGSLYAVESNGHSALILTSTDYAELHATQLDGNGEVLNVSSVTTGGLTTQAAVVWAGTHYLVAWPAFDADRRESRMLSSIITTAGTATLPRPIEVSNLMERQSNAWPALAFDGRHVLLAWITSVIPEYPFIGPGPAAAVAALLNPSGTALQTMPTVIVDGEWAGRLSLASSGAEFMVVIDDLRGGGKIRATTIVPASTGLRVDKSRDVFHGVGGAAATVEWTGTEYVVVMSHTAFNTRLALQYLDGALQETRPGRTVVTTAPRVAVQPSIVPLWGGGSLIGFSEMRGGHHLEAVTYRDIATGLLRDRPAPPVSASVAAIPGLDAHVTWTQPANGSEVEGYVVEVRTTHMIYAQIFGRDVRTARMSYFGPADYAVRSFNAAGASAATPAVPVSPHTRRRSAAR